MERWNKNIKLEELPACSDQGSSERKIKTGRDSTISRLVCGGNCTHKSGFLHDLGKISVCAKCPFFDFVRDGVEAHYKRKGQKQPVEVIFPPHKKLVSPRQKASPVIEHNGNDGSIEG